MQTALIKLCIIVVSIALTACSTTHEAATSSTVESATAEKAVPTTPVVAKASDQNTIPETNLSKTSASGELIGGSIEKMMDADDKIRMSRNPSESKKELNTHGIFQPKVEKKPERDPEIDYSKEDPMYFFPGNRPCRIL